MYVCRPYLKSFGDPNQVSGVSTTVVTTSQTQKLTEKPICLTNECRLWEIRIV